MKKNRILILILVDLLILAILAALFVPALWYYNMHRYLTRGGNTYNADIPAEKQEYYKEAIKGLKQGKDDGVFHWAVAAGGTSNVLNAVQIPFDISYYSEPGDKEPAYVVHTGETVYFSVPEDYTDASQLQTAFMLYSGMWGYGLNTWPTAEKGWRLVRPFVSAERPELQGYYYVKMEALQALQQFRYKADAEPASEDAVTYSFLVKGFSKRYRQSESFYMKAELLFNDMSLLHNETYKSPDLFKAAIPLWAVIALAGACVLANILLVVKGFRKGTHLQS